MKRNKWGTKNSLRKTNRPKVAWPKAFLANKKRWTPNLRKRPQRQRNKIQQLQRRRERVTAQDVKPKRKVPNRRLHPVPAVPK